MAYVKIIYQNSPSTATPINAENLNHMDDQIALNDQRLTEIETSYVKSFNGRKGEVVPENGDYDIGQISPLTGAQVGQVPVVTNIGTEEDPELVFEMGAGGGGGHSIIDSSGNTMPQESAMQFPDSFVTDDETNGRTIVENIKEHTTASDYENATEDGFHVIDDGNDVPIGTPSEDKVEVTADGVKTYQTLMNELYDNPKFDATKLSVNSYIFDGQHYYRFSTPVYWSDVLGGYAFLMSVGNATYTDIETIILHDTNSTFVRWENGTIIDISSYAPPQNQKFILYYGTSSTVINLKTDANYCQYDENNTVKDVLKKTISGQDYQTDYAYNTWTTHTKTFTELTTIENAFISIIGGWTTSSPHEAMIVGISGNVVTYACKGMWSGGASGINVMITAIGR